MLRAEANARARLTMYETHFTHAEVFRRGQVMCVVLRGFVRIRRHHFTRLPVQSIYYNYCQRESCVRPKREARSPAQDTHTHTCYNIYAVNHRH